MTLLQQALVQVNGEERTHLLAEQKGDLYYAHVKVRMGKPAQGEAAAISRGELRRAVDYWCEVGKGSGFSSELARVAFGRLCDYESLARLYSYHPELPAEVASDIRRVVRDWPDPKHKATLFVQAGWRLSVPALLRQVPSLELLLHVVREVRQVNDILLLDDAVAALREKPHCLLDADLLNVHQMSGKCLQELGLVRPDLACQLGTVLTRAQLERDEFRTWGFVDWLRLLKSLYGRAGRAEEWASVVSQYEGLRNLALVLPPDLKDLPIHEPCQLDVGVPREPLGLDLGPGGPEPGAPGSPAGSQAGQEPGQGAVQGS